MLGEEGRGEEGGREGRKEREREGGGGEEGREREGREGGREGGREEEREGGRERVIGSCLLLRIVPHR